MLFKKHSRIYTAISSERKKSLYLFQRHAGIKSRNLELLNQAFFHRSYANENPESIGNNEKLEFLGDSILGLVVAERLYTLLPDKAEGELARIKSFVVSENSLAAIAQTIHLNDFILIGKGEEQSGGRQKKAILADTMEAVFGAVYLDLGFEAARTFILHLLNPEIQKVLQNKHRRDYKTLLQEHVQKHYKSYPRYSVVKKSGPDHDRTFWIQVEVNGRTFGPCSGKNKKEAEREAAAIAYTHLFEETE